MVGHHGKQPYISKTSTCTLRVQRRFSITRKKTKLVIKFAGEGSGPYGRYKNLPRETRAKGIFRQ